VNSFAYAPKESNESYTSFCIFLMLCTSVAEKYIYIMKTHFELAFLNLPTIFTNEP